MLQSRVLSAAHSRIERIAFQLATAASLAETTAPDRPLRRDHAGDGRHCRRRHLHQPVCRRRTSAHTAAHSGRVDCRRRGRHAGRVHLCRTRGAPPGGWRPICVPARGVSSCRRLSLRMGVAAGDSDRRYGGRDRDLRALSAGAHGAGQSRSAPSSCSPSACSP